MADGRQQQQQQQRRPLTELYVVGPSSTGKTTLCDALASSLKLRPWCYVTEVARQVIAKRGFTTADVRRMEMQSEIMLAQLEREEQVREMALRSAGEGEGEDSILILSDRSAVDAIMYAVLTAEDERQAGQRKDCLVGRPAFRSALERYRNAKFVLLRPVPEWIVDDGVRSLEQHERSFYVFRKLLSELGIPYQEIGEEVKDLARRVDWIEEWVTTSSRPNL